MFSRWLPLDNESKYQVNDLVDVWTFSDLSATGTNYKNMDVEMKNALSMAATAAAAISSFMILV